MIVVVGSVNLDLVASVKELPNPGETVTATGLATVQGGKGANQAVAAARLGGEVHLVAALGDDGEAAVLRDGLEGDRVGIEHITTIPSTRSGVALITVDAEGENVIAVHPGANDHLVLDPDACAVIEAAGVLLMQLEIPIDTVMAAAQLASGAVIVNAAPARPLPEALIERIDVLVVNEHERDVALHDGGEDQIPVVITTVGSDGADVATAAGVQRVPAPVVNVVDTTGAGDTFCGALAEALDRGEPIIDAVSWATRAGALSTTDLGARTAMPMLTDMVDQIREST